MIFESFKDNDLAHISYIIGCEISNEVVVIDPARNIRPYTDYLERNNLKLKYVLSTHPHADFVSGHNLLCEMYQIRNVYQSDVPSEVPSLYLKDGESIEIGKSVSVQVLETPGHTPFCLSFLVAEEGVDKMVFTGDFLFNGDMGRPDLLGEETKTTLLEKSYESAVRLSTLDESILVCPSHSGGTLCGKDLRHHYLTTIGIEKRSNFSFSRLFDGKDAYIQNLKTQMLDTPTHFKKMGAINLKGPKAVATADSIRVMNLKEAFEAGVTVVDMREIYAFLSAHLPRSINIAANANVPLIAGSVLFQEEEYILVLPPCDDQRALLQRVLHQFGSVGIDRIIGVVYQTMNVALKLGVPTKSIPVVTKEALEQDAFSVIQLGGNGLDGIDTEKVELSQIGDYPFELDRKYTFVCANAYKSMTAVSMQYDLENFYFLHH